MKSIKTMSLAMSLIALVSCGSAPKEASAKQLSSPSGWTLSEGVLTPESVYFDPASKQIFFSNINGAPTDKDGNGFISILSFDAQGKPQAKKIVEGLNAPKGLRAKGGILYVTDIDEVVSIDIKTSKVLEKVTIAGAKFLNDTAIDANGTVYVSDMFANKIYQVVNGKASVFVEGPETEAPNGLLVVGNRLYVAGWGTEFDPATFGVKVPGHLAFYDLKTKARVNVTKEPIGNLDGLEILPSGDFVVTDWVKGLVLKVSAKGEVKQLFKDLQNPADFGLFGNTLVIPSMSQNKILSLAL